MTLGVEDLLWSWAIVASTVSIIGIGLLGWALRNWQRKVTALEDQVGRLEMMRVGDWDLITEHQNLLANHESRLIRLGTPGPHAVMTMDQMIEQYRRQQPAAAVSTARV